MFKKRLNLHLNNNNYGYQFEWCRSQVVRPEAATFLCISSNLIGTSNASLAQLDRASGYGPEG